MKRLVGIAILLLVPFVRPALGQNIGTHSIDWKGRSLTLELTDPPLRVSSASVQRASGNPGPRTLYYWVVTQTAAGASTPAGPFELRFAPSTLSNTATVAINWAPVANAASYDVLRTDSPAMPQGACNCAVVTGVTGTGATDQSDLLLSYTVNALDPASASLILTNEATGLAIRRGGQLASLFPGQSGCNYNLYAPSPECSNANYGWYQTNTISEPIQAPNQDTYTNLQIHQTAETGGINQSYPTVQKSNFDPFEVSLLRYTPGQSQGITSENFCGSDGDCFGVTSMTTQWGRTNAQGDEGMKAIVGNAYQGSEEFTATVASVSGNTINYSSPQYEYSRGERRYLLVTNRAVYSTGTISGISTSTVTGSGTAWTALCPLGQNHCSTENLFFELNAGNAASAQHYVVKVDQILSDTSLSLDASDMHYSSASGYAWQGDATTGGYKIYQGSIVSRVYASGGKVDVADGTQFQANDSVLMPLGNSLGVTAGDFKVKRFVPGGTANAIIDAENIGPRSVPYGLLTFGPIGNSVFFKHDPSYTPGADIRSDYGTGLANYNSVPDNTNFQILCMNRNAAVGGQFCMNYFMQYDQLKFTGAKDYIFQAASTNNELFNFMDGNSLMQFGIREGYTYFSSGTITQWYSGNQTGLKAQISGATGAAKFQDVTLTGGAQPVCNSSNAGQIWYAPGAAGVKDTVAVCAKDATNAYAWRAIY